MATQPSTFARRIGWLGMALVAGAFALNAHDIISSTVIPYLLMNLGGAIAMGVDLWKSGMRWSGPFGLQIFWIIVSVSALSKQL